MFWWRDRMEKGSKGWVGMGGAKVGVCVCVSGREGRRGGGHLELFKGKGDGLC